MGRAIYYNHQAGFITGTIQDKLLQENLQLEAPHPGVPPSAAAIIERDFFRDQLLSKHRLCNARLEEIKAKRSEVVGYQKTMMQQQAALVEKEAELKVASAKLAEMEKEMAKQDRQLEEVKEKMEKQKEGLSREVIGKFLSSNAFTVVSRVSCDKLAKAAIYEELTKLSNLYPFDPEYCGYVEISEEKRSAKALPGYTWDVERDMLMNPKGKKVKVSDSFRSMEPREIPITWKEYLTWPADIHDPEAGWVEDGRAKDGEEIEEGEAPISPAKEIGKGSGQAPEATMATDAGLEVVEGESPLNVVVGVEKSAPIQPQSPHFN